MIYLWWQVGLLFICLIATTNGLAKIHQNAIHKVMHLHDRVKIFHFGHELTFAQCVLLLLHIHWPCSLFRLHWSGTLMYLLNRAIGCYCRKPILLAAIHFWPFCSRRRDKFKLNFTLSPLLLQKGQKMDGSEKDAFAAIATYSPF